MDNNQYADFLQKVDDLPAGDRVALKRASGAMLSEADGKAIAAFYRCNPPDTWQEERFFAAACIKCLWAKRTSDGEAPAGIPAEQLLSQMDLSDSMRHRIEGLLDTPWDRDGYLLTKLTRIIKMIRQNDTREPDFAALLEDLIYWNSDNQRVQRKWARAVFSQG